MLGISEKVTQLLPGMESTDSVSQSIHFRISFHTAGVRSQLTGCSIHLSFYSLGAQGFEIVFFRDDRKAHLFKAISAV